MKTLLVSYFFVISSICFCQEIFNDTIVHEFRIRFPQPDWQELLKENKDSSIDIPALLTLDGSQLDSVGVRYKGNSSYNAPSQKKSLNISLDAFIGEQSYDGFTTFNLNNGFKDPSFVREIISYKILSNLMPAPKAAYTKLYINDDYWGLYVLVQQPDKKFLRDAFGGSDGNYYKGDPRGDLTWLGDSSGGYKKSYEKKTNESEDDWSDLIAFIRTLNFTTLDKLPDEIEKILDVDRVLWYFAFCNAFCNLDSYIGSGHNYFIYDNPTDGRFNVIPWDLNENLGVFQMQMKIPQLQALPWDFPLKNPQRPLFSILMSIDYYKERYISHLTALLEDFLNEDYWLPLIEKYQKLIESDLAGDTKKLYTMEMFHKNVNEDTPLSQGPTAFVVPGVISFINAREKYFIDNPLFSLMQSNIKSYTQAPEKPEASDSVKIEAMVILAKNVNLCYSFNKLPFVKIPMILTQPGDVTDIWETTIPPAYKDTYVRYYFEAQSYDDAFFYYPRYAEYDYISYNVFDTAGYDISIVINEVQPANKKTIADPQGGYADWVELYNKGNEEHNLSSYYLSDNPSNPLKWKFPDGTIVNPGEYLIVWADEDTLDSPGLHANFKLSKAGEWVLLSAGGSIIDSCSYPEIADDSTYGRIPNGSGKFKMLQTPTPNAMNVDTVTFIFDENKFDQSLTLIHESGNIFLKVISSQATTLNIQIFDLIGRLIVTKKTDIITGENIIPLDIQYLSSGVYIINIIYKNKSSHTTLIK